VGWIGAIIIGVAAGWITGQLMRGSGYGFWLDLVLGLAGSLVGGWLSAFLIGADLTTGFNLTSLIVSVIGAVVIVALYRLITRRSIARE
jgi:uncharacterized membrane protein YeaQ/YmgE (transglycosylase-associated protein family)